MGFPMIGFPRLPLLAFFTAEPVFPFKGANRSFAGVLCLAQEHHAALAQFPVQMRPVSEDYVFDWTGLRFPTGLCRRLAPQWFCRLQEAYLRSGLQLAYPPLPLVDDDYPLTVAICQAILQARPQ